MASESNEILTVLKIIGAGEYSRAAHYASASVRDIDSAQTRAERSGRKLGERMDNLSNKAGRGMARAATVGVTFGAGLVKMGLNFDAMIERSQIGISSLVGDMGEAKKITADVRGFALKAPLFGTEQMVKTAQQLIGAGYDAKNVVPYLTTFSDTLSALGRKPEDLQRMTYAFVQMMSKGQISAEELRGQLGEIFPAQKILAREMGLSTNEFAKKMKQGTFKGTKYINLLLRGMEKDFGGSTEKMATTFDGQLANIRESTKYTLGILFKPLFHYLERDAFPAIKSLGDDMVATMTDASLTSAQKFQQIKQAADFWLTPIWDDFKNALGKVEWGTQIAAFVNKVAPPVMSAMGKLGARATQEFLRAWIASDIWGKLFGAALVARIIGFKTVFGLIGKAAGSAMGKKVAKEVATEMVGETMMTRMTNAGKVAGSAWGRAWGAAARTAAIGAVLLGLTEISKKVRDSIREMEGQSKWEKVEPSKKARTALGDPTAQPPLGWETTKKIGSSIWDYFANKAKSGAQGRAHGGPVSSGSPYVVGERGPELFVPNMGGNIRPSLGGMTLHNYMILDGRVASQSVAKHNFNEMARR